MNKRRMATLALIAGGAAAGALAIGARWRAAGARENAGNTTASVPAGAAPGIPGGGRDRAAALIADRARGAAFGGPAPSGVALREAAGGQESALDAAVRAQTAAAYRELTSAARLSGEEDKRLRAILADAQDNWRSAVEAWRQERDEAMRAVLADAAAATAQMAASLDDNPDTHFDRLAREVSGAIASAVGEKRRAQVQAFLDEHLRDVLDTRPFARAEP